ncbi:MAG: hypothetical protein WCI53_11505 [Bacteroidota bacterium]
MKIKYFICLSMLYFFFTSVLVAQKNSKENNLPKLGLVTRNGTDSIILRWIIEDRQLFLKGIENGYRILRADFESEKIGKYAEVSLVKPWTKNNWQKTLKAIKDTSLQTYKYLNLGYELIYNNEKYLPSGLANLGEIVNAKSQNELGFLFIIIGSCMDNKTADALGLRWVDRNITKGQKYRYKIEPIGAEKNEKFQGSEMEAEAVNPNLANNTIINPTENEISIELKWKVPNYPIIGYSLDRSEDNGLTFQRLNKSLIVIGEILDSNQNEIGIEFDTTVVMYKPYIYKLIGHTLFADEILVGSCKAMARDRTPVSCIFVPNPESTPGTKALLKWELQCAPSDLVGFKVRRGTNKNGPFTKLLTPNILSPKTTSFIDPLIDMDNENFYVIQTIDTAGNIFTSSPAYLLKTDTTPPREPVWISAKSDTNGLVTLKLMPNPENDFMGFRIMQANQEDHEFSTIIENFSKDSSFKINRFDTLFHDTITLNSLTKFVYYKAFALDRNYNTSKSSKIIKVARPDIIPPVSPVLTSIIPTDTCLILNIIPSSSSDVVNMNIYRSFENDANFEDLGTIKPNDTIFFDGAILAEKTYYYKLTSSDSSNNVSNFSFIQKGRTYDSGIRNGVESFKAVYDNDSKEIVVTWNYKANKSVNEEVFFQVYSSTGDNELQRCAVLAYSNGVFTYRNKVPKLNEIYNYAVRVVTSKGAESEMSKTKSIQILDN